MQENNPTLFLDFDETLFDNTKARNFILNDLKEHGITQEIWGETYELVKKEYKGVYNREEHFFHLSQRASQSFDVSVHYKKYIEFVSECIYPDVLPFLKRYKESRVVIVTYGEEEFQTEKIEHSNILEYIDATIITDRAKSEALKDVFDGVSGIFIDDRIEHLDDIKKAYPTIETILIDRHTTNTQTTHRKITSLDEL